MKLLLKDKDGEDTLCFRALGLDWLWWLFGYLIYVSCELHYVIKKYWSSGISFIKLKQFLVFIFEL